MSTLLDSPLRPTPVQLVEDGPDPDLHQQTVPRRLVHRASVSEVLITGWRRVGADRFLVGAQWPRGHSFYAPVEEVHDPLIVAETLRQAALLLSHVAYEIPLDHAFLMQDMSFQVDPGKLGVGAGPTDVTIGITGRDIRRRRSVVSAMRYDFAFYRGHEHVGGGGGAFESVSPQAYARLRGDAFERHVMSAPLQYDGRLGHRVRDSVLAPTATRYRWVIEADRRHPVLFDHPVDHLPGMVLVEAMRQAAKVVTGRRLDGPFGLDVSFAKYAELDRPVFVQATPGQPRENGDRVVRVEVEQDGETVAQGVLDIRALPGAAEPRGQER
ncbi:ScbA/BarX family gamma-butyrolactone biosynthesis protein [Streptacidiphilus pinicola]|nr:ScbA/BarX family gamma-butyrolactone biosynthesis protein [Streptacidiphilus pinicola]